MKQHKHLPKLNELIKRMDIWEQAGPSVSAAEYDTFVDCKREVHYLIEQCINDIDWTIPNGELIKCNMYWKKFNILR
tara:strand:- start:350 stop:580 length:231 start_codon:yes stop_codon:yes gene_type:complete